jgi:hypothetical protein
MNAPRSGSRSIWLNRHRLARRSCAAHEPASVTHSCVRVPGWRRAFTGCVIIDHGNAEYGVMMHMQPSSVTVRAGDRVVTGQVIGKLGNSGDSFGPHLHYQLQSGPRLFQDQPLPFSFQNIDGHSSEAGSSTQNRLARGIGGSQWGPEHALPGNLSPDRSVSSYCNPIGRTVTFVWEGHRYDSTRKALRVASEG